MLWLFYEYFHRKVIKIVYEVYIWQTHNFLDRDSGNTSDVLYTYCFRIYSTYCLERIQLTEICIDCIENVLTETGIRFIYIKMTSLNTRISHSARTTINTNPKPLNMFVWFLYVFGQPFWDRQACAMWKS